MGNFNKRKPQADNFISLQEKALKIGRVKVPGTETLFLVDNYGILDNN